MKMEKEDFLYQIEKENKQIGIMLNVEQQEKFYNYMKLLIEWNEKINLTAITAPKEIITKHFIDSVTILKHIEPNSKIIDIGTGAGFPGIPIKIVNNSLDITLIDSLNKRIKFLNEVIQELDLKDIQAIHSRAEEIGQNKIHREKYDIVVSRAVANLNILIEYMIPLLKIGGKCICMKGPNIKEEISESKNAINILGGEIEEIEELILPETDIKRTIIIIRKVKPTPKQYPRKAGTPSKNPIK